MWRRTGPGGSLHVSDSSPPSSRMPPNRNPSNCPPPHPIGEQRLANRSPWAGQFRTNSAALRPRAPHSAGKKRCELERQALQVRPTVDGRRTWICPSPTSHGIVATNITRTANVRVAESEHGRVNLGRRSDLIRTAGRQSHAPVNGSRTATLGVPNNRAFVENASWRFPNSGPPNPERQPATTERRAPNRERLNLLIEPYKPFNHPTHG